MRRSDFPTTANLLTLIAIAGAPWFLAGCAYTLGTTLPSNLRSIHVPTFVNQSGEPQIENETTQATIQEFQRDGNLRIVDADKADLLLTVTLTGYKLEPVRYERDNTRQNAEYRARISATMQLKRGKSGEVMLKQAVEGESTFLFSGDLTSSKRTALPKATQDLAHNIVEKVVEYW